MKENYTKNSLFATYALFSTIKGFKKVFGTSKFIEKSIFVFIIVFLCFAENLSAQGCSITSTTKASDLTACTTLSLSSCGGIVYIGNGSDVMSLTIDSDFNLGCLGSIQFVVRKNATVQFGSGANEKLTLGEGSSIIVESGGIIDGGKNCTASDRIYIGDILVATCSGKANAEASFDTIEALGGTGSATSNSPVCVGSLINLTATPPPIGTFKYLWSGPGLAATTTYISNPSIALSAAAGGVYRVAMKRDSDGLTVFATTTVVVVNSKPTTPTLNPKIIKCVATSFVADWTAVTNARGYQLDVATDPLFGAGSFVSGYEDKPLGNVLSHNVVGLSPGSVYYVRLRAVNSCGASANSAVITVSAPVKIYKNGGWVNGVPEIDENIVFEGDYSENVDVKGCSCEVKSGNVTIASGKTMTITNGVKVTGGSLTFKNNASLVQTNDDAVNTGSISYIRTNTTSRETDYTYWSSPVKLPKLIDVSPQTLSGFFYSFNASANNWIYVNPYTNSMVPGKGYIFRGPYYTGIPASGFYDAPFVGVPNNGEIEIDIAGYSNLIGNPYPSALDADSFLIANRGVLQGTLYFWTHSTAIRAAVGASNEGSGTFVYISDDYASYNLTGGVGTEIKKIIKTGNTTPSGENESNRPSGKIAAGQGFFATGKAAGQAIFKNSMRVGVEVTTGSNSNDQFFKVAKSSKNTNTIEKNRVWLNLTNDKGAFKQVLVGYITDATNGYDNTFDGGNNNGNQFVNFYSINENKNLTIQGRALPFDENDVVPLGYSSVIQGSFSISIDEVDGMLTSENIYLEDKSKNTIHDLKKSSYTFETEKGTFNDRFVLRYKDRTLSSADFELNDSSVIIAKVKNELKIKSETETISQIAIFDLLGRKVFEKAAINSNDFETSAIKLSNQMFVVKVTLANGKLISKKVMY